MIPAKLRSVYRRHRVDWRQLGLHEFGRDVPYPQSGLEPENKGLNPCRFFAVRHFQRVEIWLPSVDTFRTFAAQLTL